MNIFDDDNRLGAGGPASPRGRSRTTLANPSVRASDGGVVTATRKVVAIGRYRKTRYCPVCGHAFTSCVCPEAA